LTDQRMEAPSATTAADHAHEGGQHDPPRGRVARREPERHEDQHRDREEHAGNDREGTHPRRAYQRLRHPPPRAGWRNVLPEIARVLKPDMHVYALAHGNERRWKTARYASPLTETNSYEPRVTS
jgi:hypothetical protein